MDILNQLTKQRFLHPIREYSFKTAFEKGLLAGPKIDEIKLPVDISNQFADRIIIDFEQLLPISNIMSIKNELLRGFVYMFDKGVEITYFSRVLQDTKIKYNFGDLMNGLSGDTFPIYIQEQVNPNIPVLADIYYSIIEYIDHKKDALIKQNINTKDLMKLVLVGGAFLGVEFCLRIELQNDNW